MAVTVTLYNHTAKLLANKEVTLTTIKAMLVNNHTFDVTDTDLSGITGNEVSGSGWDVGGELIANVAVTTVTTNDAKLDGDDISVTATGGAIGIADGCVIYDDTGNFPLAYYDFGGDQEAGEGTDFRLTFNASGIFTFTVT